MMNLAHRTVASATLPDTVAWRVVSMAARCASRSAETGAQVRAAGSDEGPNVPRTPPSEIPSPPMTSDVSTAQVGDKRDWMISTPHPGSRLRKTRLPLPKDGQQHTALENQLQTELDSDFDWHHKFWSAHNHRFEVERKEFVDQFKKDHGLGPRDRVPADDMSVFYKDFANATAEQQKEYARRWRRRNIYLVWLRIKNAVAGMMQ
eukprot:m.188968 g.188968  ORF g.188968 m.188968 type:complete len:205 (-) comp17596_c0_seq1:159-773(-)